MTTPLELIDSLRAQRAEHNAQIARGLCRITASDVEPIRDAWVVEPQPGFLGSAPKLLIGFYQRVGYGYEEPSQSVYAGDACDLYGRRWWQVG